MRWNVLVIYIMAICSFSTVFIAGPKMLEYLFRLLA